MKNMLLSFRLSVMFAEFRIWFVLANAWLYYSTTLVTTGVARIWSKEGHTTTWKQG